MRMGVVALVALAACSGGAHDEEAVVARTSSALGAPTKLKEFTYGATASLAPPGNFANDNGMIVGGKLVVQWHDTLHGDEPWVSDGTVAGTMLLRDTQVGSTGGIATSGLWASLGAVGTFVASIEGRRWIWRTDGTTAGTYPLASSTSPANAITQLVKSGSSIYFLEYGNSIWKTDGTVAGTTKVKDGVFYEMADGGGTLYLAATNGLYKSDGTSAGTTLVSNAVTASKMAAAGGWVYFVKSSVPTELWRSDGGATTEKVTTLPGQAYSMTPYGASVVFLVSASTGWELWKVDTGGASLIKQMTQSLAATCSGLAVANGVVMFQADDGTNGNQVWRSDGTTNGTTIVKVLNTGGANGVAGGFSPKPAVWNNGIAFYGYGGTGTGYEPTFTDGTDLGTVLIDDVAPGSLPSSVTTYYANGATLFLGQNGGVLWKTSAVGSATKLRVIDPGTAPAPTNLVANANKLYFTEKTSYGSELSLSDGTPAGTAKVRSDDAVTSVNYVTTMGGKVYFAASSTATGTELFTSDGTSAGTVVAADIAPSGSSNPVWVKGAGTHVFFYATGPDGQEPYAWDPVNGAVLLADITPSGSSIAWPFTPFKDGALFTAYDPGTSSPAVWYSDGTAAGTLRLGGGTVYDGTAIIGGTAYYGSGTGLWSTDGTLANTTQIKALTYPGAYNVIAAGTKVFFVAANDGGSGNDRELWMSDGTTGGTSRVVDLNAGSAGSNPWSLTALGTKVVFRADDGTGYRWYASDGTAIGTVKLTDAYAGQCEPLVVGSTIYLCAADEAGEELWTSDGTPAGTTRWFDLNPGAARSGPRSLTLVNNKLFFTAYEGTTAGLYVTDPGLPNPPQDAGADAGGDAAASSSSGGIGSSGGSNGSTSSASSTSGSNAQPLDDTNGSPADSGCGCRTVPRARTSGPYAVLALLALLTVRRTTRRAPNARRH